MKKIGIAGVGGIGSNIALHLVRAGIPALKYADFDTIDKSNLNRQFYFADQIGMPKTVALDINLKRVNADVTLTYFQTRVTSQNVFDLFGDCDIIVEGFDNVESKKLLIESFINTDKIIVSANGIASTDTDSIRVIRKNNLFMVGDFEKDIKDFKTYSHKVGTVAAVMAGIVYENC